MNLSFSYSLRLIIIIQRLLITGLVALGCLTLSAQAATVSVSNYPLFLLSQAVTQGAPSAEQILDPSEVGHHGSISPGDIKTIQDSTFVVWFGASLEHNLATSLDKAPNAISLYAFDAFNRHPLRDVKGQPIKGTLDPHIWLDPENAKAITRALAVIHSHANPQYKSLYQANTKKFAQRMDEAVAAQSKLGGKARKAQPYWAYHDSYQYLERATQLQFAGSLSVDEDLAPKASQLRWLNEHRPSKTMCIVTQSEPAKGLLAKLQPVKSTLQSEDMSASKDFVSGWQMMAQQIRQCIS
ncbi:metal ABC transporter solute-binding protein, Zn/Mn family [Psychrobacter sp.]|uniref:metal ABC transporter solute-binding protein, Zn/Mn family n=1 Tax=Psychrobacter sp. TaxID=56811 RepID=UPI003BB1072D